MQPTHARWEQVAPSSVKSEALQNTKVAGIIGDDDTPPGRAAETLFPDMPTVFTRNFMITDTYYATPPTSTLGCPGPDEHLIDVGPGGLTHVPDHVLAVLPEGCRQAFVKARAEERVWKESWSNENDDSARAKLRITYNT